MGTQQRNGNNADGHGMGHVSAPKQYGYLGNINNVSANALYRRYREWMDKSRPGKKQLSFGQWMGWAKKAGVVSNNAFRWDGTEDLGSGNLPSSELPVNVDEPQEVTIPKEDVVALQKADHNMQKAMLWLAGITTVIAIVGFATRK